MSVVPVSAAQLTVYSCHDPAGTAVGHDGWVQQRTSDTNMTVADACGGSNQGSLLLDVGPNPIGYQDSARVLWAFLAPSWSTIASYTIKLADSYAIPSTGGGMGQVFVNASDESDPNYDYRNLGSGLLGATLIQRTPPTPPTSLLIDASCDGQDGPCPANVQISHVDISATTILLNDLSTPSVSGLGGSLVSGTALRGNSEVSFNATDSGPGIYSGWLVVDGQPQPSQVLNLNNGMCQNLGQTSNGTRAFARPEPCAHSVSASLTFDTSRLADGRHTLKVMVDDAAGNATIAYAGSFTTANHDSHAKPRIILKITPRETRNKHTIHWTGRIIGGALPDHGVTVLAQARQGHGWIVFRQIPVNSKGRFNFNYRFHSTTIATTYHFRVALAHAGRYSFGHDNSNVVKVGVRP